MSTRPDPGQSDTLAPGVRRVLAPNPSPMTHWGTNTYIVGEGRVAVIDPGPGDPAHLAAIGAATRGEEITHILVTHAHRDHSPLARALAERTGAPVLAYGPPEAGRSPVMTRLAGTGAAAGGEGVDAAFRPDTRLADGDVVQGDGWRLTALWTPGHFAGHLSFDLDGLLFTGDHVMDWASSLVSPPDGDLGAFMASCARLAAHPARIFHAGHGAPVTDPAGRLQWLIDHRRGREAQILDALGPAPEPIATLTARIYTDIPAAMLPAAERNVFAHLVDLVGRNLADATPDLAWDARFSRR